MENEEKNRKYTDKYVKIHGKKIIISSTTIYMLYALIPTLAIISIFSDKITSNRYFKYIIDTVNIMIGIFVTNVVYNEITDEYNKFKINVDEFKHGGWGLPSVNKFEQVEDELLNDLIDDGAINNDKIEYYLKYRTWKIKKIVFNFFKTFNFSREKDEEIKYNNMKLCLDYILSDRIYCKKYFDEIFKFLSLHIDNGINNQEYLRTINYWIMLSEVGYFNINIAKHKKILDKYYKTRIEMNISYEYTNFVYYMWIYMYNGMSNKKNNNVNYITKFIKNNYGFNSNKKIIDGLKIKNKETDKNIVKHHVQDLIQKNKIFNKYTLTKYENEIPQNNIDNHILINIDEEKK